MWTFITGFFSSSKNIIMAIGSALVVGYVGVQKYKAYRAEDKLKTVENKIAKTNVIIAKEKAKAKAQSIKAETDTEVEVLRELNKEAKIIEEEMLSIEEEVQKRLKAKGDKISTTRRRQGNKVKVEV